MKIKYISVQRTSNASMPLQFFRSASTWY